MRRTTGAILIETRPEMISRSAWRGEARNASQPKRATSTRAPTIAIISIAQQASPKVAGNIALRARPVWPPGRASSCSMLSSTCFSQLGALELAVEHLAGGELARAELAVRRRAELLALHLHSSAPLRHT